MHDTFIEVVYPDVATASTHNYLQLPEAFMRYNSAIQHC